MSFFYNYIVLYLPSSKAKGTFFVFKNSESLIPNSHLLHKFKFELKLLNYECNEAVKEETMDVVPCPFCHLPVPSSELEWYLLLFFYHFSVYAMVQSKPSETHLYICIYVYNGCSVYAFSGTRTIIFLMSMSSNDWQVTWNWLNKLLLHLFHLHLW